MVYRTSHLEHKDADGITFLSAPERDRRDLFHRTRSHAVAIGTLFKSDDIKGGKSSGLVLTRHGLPRAASEAQLGTCKGRQE